MGTPLFVCLQHNAYQNLLNGSIKSEPRQKITQEIAVSKQELAQDLAQHGSLHLYTNNL